ncbi:MAG: hypothetical protein J6386_17580 [Candidatus Synoicihabitans palmerolidicus]|nr:hypothetical protein [Candidatus Synoicihabitans palmerolidicus]
MSRDRYVSHLLGTSLHGPWSWLWPLIQNRSLTWFYRDYELLLAISILHNRDDIDAEILEFRHLHMNHHGRRGFLRLRISTQRLSRAVEAIPGVSSGSVPTFSASPFPTHTSFTESHR